MSSKREDAPGRPEVIPAGPRVSSSGSDARHEVVGIGPSISLVGEITGDEDLTVLGRIEGKIQVPKHAVTVGPSGRVKADIHAKLVSVEGEVRGNLYASEQILIRKTATMMGNLTAPRVGLEDGCRFKGSVDMEMPAEKAHASPPPPRTPAAESPKPAIATAAPLEPQ